MEKDIEKECKGFVKSVGGKFVKQSTSIGIVDRIVILPLGVTVYYEAKLKGTLSRPQRIYISDLIDMGHKVIVTDSFEVFKDFISFVLSNPLVSIHRLDEKYKREVNDYRDLIGVERII